MRRVLVWLTTVGLLFCSISALAGTLDLAANPDMHLLFRRYQSYKLEGNGTWQALDLKTSQLRRIVSEGGARTHMSNGAVLLYPGVRGNTELGLTEAILNVCLLKSAPIGADSLSITVNHTTRYDFLAESRKDRIGAYSCELFELPLDKQGWNMLESIAESGCSISIYGGTKVYKTSIMNSSNLSEKEKLESESLNVIRSFINQYGHFFSRYTLWDRNAGLWASGRPEMSVVNMKGDINKSYSKELPELDESEQMLTTNRTAVSIMQQILIDGNFYAGKIDGKYGTATRSAIREAQQYYGLLQTGQADRLLIECILSDSPASCSEDTSLRDRIQLSTQDDTIYAEANLLYYLEGVAEVVINHYWFANKIMPTNCSSWYASPTVSSTSNPRLTTTPSPTATPSPSANAIIVPRNSSNKMLIYEGEIMNLSSEDLFLPMSVSAEIIIDKEFSYPLSIRCEQNEETLFGTTLLPLERSKIILYAEVPCDQSRIKEIEFRFNLNTSVGKIVLIY